MGEGKEDKGGGKHDLSLSGCQDAPQEKDKRDVRLMSLSRYDTHCAIFSKSKPDMRKVVSSRISRKCKYIDSPNITAGTEAKTHRPALSRPLIDHLRQRLEHSVPGWAHH